jgi:predicted nucleic acid-binding Zn finger protein
VRFEPYWNWCSCPDNSIRSAKCKHLIAVEYSIRKGTLKDIDKLPPFVKRDNMIPESYRDDEYDF